MDESEQPVSGNEHLLLSSRSREHLRQLLCLDSLVDDEQLIGAVKEALRTQYSRGFHEGLAESEKQPAPQDPPPEDTATRRLSPSTYRGSPSSAERRSKRRRQRRLRRLRSAMVTTLL